MKKKILLTLIIVSGLLFLAPTDFVKAAPWGSEGVPGQPSGSSVCDHHDSSGSCLYSVQASGGGQAWQGHFSANFIGTAGFIGPGNATVTGCLSENTTLYSTGSSCWLIYKKDLSNSSDTFSDSNQFNIGTDPVPKFKYWVVNIYGDESYAYNIQYSVESRLVTIKDFSANTVTVSTGQQFTISWDTKDVYVGDVPQISWVGSIQDIDTPQNITPNIPGSKTFIAGSTPGTATISLTNVCGPSANGRICLADRYIDITVTSSTPTPVPTPTPGPFTLNPTSCQGSGFFNLSWTSSANAASYNVYKRAWSTGAGNPWVQIGSGVTGTSYTTQESLGTDWYFYIEAVNPYGKTSSTPGPPDGLYGGSCPAALSCSPATQTIASGASASVSASGGNTSSYSWSAPDGNPPSSTGSSPNFLTSYTNTGSSPATKTITVSSGGQTAQCSVVVNPAPASAPTCSASPNQINSGQTTTFTGSGGSGGQYQWHAADGAFLGSGITMSQQYFNTGSTDKVNTVKVTRDSGSGFCSVTIKPAGQLPSADLRCNGFGTSCTIPGGAEASLSWCGSPGQPCANATSCPLYVKGYNKDGSPATGWIPTGYSNTSASFVSTGVPAYPISDYELRCTGPGGQNIDIVRVIVASAGPTGSILCNGSTSTTVSSGGAVSLTWSSSNADQCGVGYNSEYFWTGTSSGGSPPTDNPTSTRTYALDCWNTSTPPATVSFCTANVGSTTGTVVINSNDSAAANYLKGPAPCDVGLGCGWNGPKTWSDRLPGTYSVNANPVAGKTVTVTPSSAALFAGRTITFDIVYTSGGGGQPTPPPGPEKAGGECRVNVSGFGPSASNVSVTKPNYCFSGPGGIINWTYSDPTGSPQSVYQVQVDDQGSFNSPEIDSGKVSCQDCRAYSFTQGILQFNTTYRARVRTWNQNGTVSSWAESGSWKTPPHAFPQVNFTFASAVPGQQQLVPNQPVQFTDQTRFFDSNPNGRRWSWLFGDGGVSTAQNPKHNYFQPNNYNVTLTATDNANQSCSITKPINIKLPNPIWKEVNPGG